MEIDKGHTERLYNRELHYSLTKYQFSQSQEFLLQLCVYYRKRMNSGNYTPCSQTSEFNSFINGWIVWKVEVIFFQSFMINWGVNLNLEANKNLTLFMFMLGSVLFYQFPPFRNSYIESVIFRSAVRDPPYNMWLYYKYTALRSTSYLLYIPGCVDFLLSMAINMLSQVC